MLFINVRRTNIKFGIKRTQLVIRINLRFLDAYFCLKTA